MKDAKGHGSNPRGDAAHQTGVSQVGRVVPMAISSLTPTQPLSLDAYDEQTDRDTVDYFRGQLRSGRDIDPPIQVFPNGQVAEGHHRIIASLLEGRTDIAAETIPYDHYSGRRRK